MHVMDIRTSRWQVPAVSARQVFAHLHIVVVGHFWVVDDAASVQIGNLYEDAGATLGLQDVACQVLTVEVHIALPVGVLGAHVAGEVFAAQESARIAEMLQSPCHLWRCKAAQQMLLPLQNAPIPCNKCVLAH